MDDRSTTPTKLAYGITEACKSVGLGRSFLYQEIAAGRLRTFKVGTRTLIRSSDLLVVLDEMLVVEIVAVEAMGLQLSLGELRHETAIGIRQVAGRAIRGRLLPVVTLQAFAHHRDRVHRRGDRQHAVQQPLPLRVPGRLGAERLAPPPNDYPTSIQYR